MRAVTDDERQEVLMLDAEFRIALEFYKTCIEDVRQLGE